jgi:hypothetical protein
MKQISVHFNPSLVIGFGSKHKLHHLCHDRNIANRRIIQLLKGHNSISSELCHLVGRNSSLKGMRDSAAPFSQHQLPSRTLRVRLCEMHDGTLILIPSHL